MVKSTQLDAAVPPSTISALSSGEFVGMVADDPAQKIKHKLFHNEIINDHEVLRKEELQYKNIPDVRQLGKNEVENNYRRIKQEVRDIIEIEMERIYNSPELAHLLIVDE